MFQVQWFSDWPLITRSLHLKLAGSDYFAAYIGIHVCMHSTMFVVRICLETLVVS